MEFLRRSLLVTSSIFRPTPLEPVPGPNTSKARQVSPSSKVGIFFAETPLPRCHTVDRQSEKYIEQAREKASFLRGPVSRSVEFGSFLLCLSSHDARIIDTRLTLEPLETIGGELPPIVPIGADAVLSSFRESFGATRRKGILYI